jgi:hypothetical protein
VGRQTDWCAQSLRGLMIFNLASRQMDNLGGDPQGDLCHVLKANEGNIHNADDSAVDSCDEFVKVQWALFNLFVSCC